jgi:DNA-binding transcriptional ArsR family regulator
MNGDTMKATLRVTKALADQQRIRILMMLGAGELCVCQVIEVLALAPSTVSKHLSILSNAGLVDSRKEGRWMYYRLSEGKDGAFVRPPLKWLGNVLEGDAVLAQDARKLKTALASEPKHLCRRQRERAQ